MTAMFDFIRDIFKKEDSSRTVIRIDEVSGILDKSEKELDSDIRARTSEHMKKIENARGDLIDLVETLSSAEWEEAFHPKLEKIAKNTLPLFVKSMHAALSRDLPGEPGEFYQAATECLKGCVKSQAGPGRYLQGVFPDEMKAIRVMIDTIGREMNSMTPVISEARKRRELIRGCREIYTSLMEQIREMESCRMEIPRLESDLLEHRENLSKTSDNLSRTMEGEEAEKLKNLHKLEESARQDVTAIERQLRAVFSNISHVFRKGEKIMQRGESGRAPNELHLAIELLSGRDIPRKEDLEKNMDPILGSVQSMIESGEITLKNKEEKKLFSDPKAIRVILSDLYLQRREAEERLGDITEQYGNDPARARINALEREIEMETQQIHEFEEELQILKETAREAESVIPKLCGELENRLGAIAGKEIVLESVPVATH
jgi:predicted  nucleic acid-binding Zn-ribbon protein